jgi:hypothetical protein
MTQEALKPFGPEEIPHVELRNDKGKLYSPPGISVHSEQIWFEGDEVLARIQGMGDAVVVGPGGRAARYVAAFPRPGSNQRASFERADGGGTFYLEGPDRDILFRTRLLQHNLGRESPASIQWSPSGGVLAVGGQTVLAILNFEAKTCVEWTVSTAAVQAVAWLDDERVALLDGGRLMIWNILTGTLVTEHTDKRFRQLWGLAAAPDRSELFVGGQGLFRVPTADLERAEQVALPVSDPKRSIQVCGFEPNGRALLVASGTQLFRLAWPTLTVLECVDVPSGLEAAAANASGDRIVTAGWCNVRFFARGAEGPRHYDMPSFPVRSVPAARRGQSGKFPKTLKALEKRVEAIQPFSQLGEPLPYDKYLTRVSTFKAWGGPESAEDDALSMQVGSWQEATKEAIKIGKKDLAPIKPLIARARDLAEQRIQLTPEEEDDNYAPRYAALVYFEEVVRLVATFLLLDEKIPDDLKELFLLFEAGHWPCGYQVDPGPENDEPKVEKLIVY